MIKNFFKHYHLLLPYFSNRPLKSAKFSSELDIFLLSSSFKSNNELCYSKYALFSKSKISSRYLLIPQWESLNTFPIHISIHLSSAKYNSLRLCNYSNTLWKQWKYYKHRLKYDFWKLTIIVFYFVLIYNVKLQSSIIFFVKIVRLIIWHSGHFTELSRQFTILLKSRKSHPVAAVAFLEQLHCRARCYAI